MLEASEGKMLEHMEVISTFYDQIKRSQFENKKLNNLKEKVLQSKTREDIPDV